MTLALFVFGEGIPSAQRIFDIAAPTVFSSILLHGPHEHARNARRTEAASRRHTPATSVG